MYNLFIFINIRIIVGLMVLFMFRFCELLFSLLLFFLLFIRRMGNHRSRLIWRMRRGICGFLRVEIGVSFFLGLIGWIRLMLGVGYFICLTISKIITKLLHGYSPPKNNTNYHIHQPPSQSTLLLKLPSLS